MPTRREKRAKAFGQRSTEQSATVEAVPRAPSPGGPWSRPMEIDPVSAAFGGGPEVMKMMPAYADIPAEFRDMNDRTHWNRLQSEWFFRGVSTKDWKAKPGTDKAKAVRHLAAIQGSFTPPHEHKSAGVAYLMSLWFEEPTS